MKDHAQAKIELINAAIAMAEQITSENALATMNQHARIHFERVRRAAEEYKTTKQAKRVDENGDEFDSLHGCG